MNGVINFLKPPGMSSNGAVVFLRGVLGVRKTGHAGTLDPGACGVLPICIGKATKISAYMMGGTKEYIAEITFGKHTDTADSYGTVIETSSVVPGQPQVIDVLEGLRGDIVQQTPAYSAVKHNGRKLYQLARAGIEIAPKMRNVRIDDIVYIAQTRPDAHLIRVRCGKGTYIRTLCEDVGRALGTVAYMSFLVRSECAGLDIASSITADELKDMPNPFDVLLPIDMFLQKMTKTQVDEQHRKTLFNGGSIACSDDIADEEIRVYVNDELLGIGTAGAGRIKITTLLVDE